MPVQVVMPQLGESVQEGTINKWLIAEGDSIREFEPLLEVNTDKVDTEIPSPASGVLLKILVEEGAIVKVGTNLAWIGDSDEQLPEKDTKLDLEESSITTNQPATLTNTNQVSLRTEQYLVPSPGRDRQLGFISPVVAKIASEENVDLTQVTGTGRDGRITKKDLLAYIDTQRTTKRIKEPSIVSTPIVSTPESTEIPPSVIPDEILSITPVRRAIADHMVKSKHTSPHVTTVMEADLSRVLVHREKNKAGFARDGVNLTYTAYFVAASIEGLKRFPIVNSSWSDSGIIIHRDINIGMATALGDAGLIVPVIRNADTLSLFGIVKAVNDLSERARNRSLNPDEVHGGTFTITNHGTSGSLFATPIINQPQCGILGVGVIQKRVIVINEGINDAIAIRPMVYLSLTFDHRILDGASADYFLAEVVKSLETWN